MFLLFFIIFALQVTIPSTPVPVLNYNSALTGPGGQREIVYIWGLAGADWTGIFHKKHGDNI